ncbi:putative RNA helicase SDE3 [Chloropicon roscoffensis]|uniref:RNA helicase SDE3 n=3 Tax=Chloropicon roscoffensis TaxID=1461544 RepID=A0AAX4PAC4_9CHLO
MPVAVTSPDGAYYPVAPGQGAEHYGPYGFVTSSSGTTRKNLFHDKVTRCLDAVCKALSCGYALGSAVLSVLAVREENGADEFAYDANTIVKLETLGAVLDFPERKVYEALAWMEDGYRSGALGGELPAIVGGNELRKTKQGGKGGFKTIGALPQALGRDVEVGILLCAQQGGGRVLSVNSGRDASGPLAPPRSCGPCTGYPLDLHELRERGNLAAQVEDSLRRRPRRRRAGLVARDPPAFCSMAAMAAKNKKKTFYRQVRFWNRSGSPVFLLQAKLRGGHNSRCPGLSLSDDHSISETDLAEDAGGREEVVRLDPSREYEVTVAWDGEAKIGRGTEVALSFWNEESGFGVVVAAVRVAGRTTSGEASISSSRAAAAGTLSSEADLYVSERLKRLFRRPPSAVLGVESVSLVSGLIGLGILPAPRPAPMISTPFKSAADVESNLFAIRLGSLPPLTLPEDQHRLEVRRAVLMREAIEVRDRGALEMFSVKISAGVVDLRRRRYRELADEGTDSEPREGPYAGPDLLAFRSQHNLSSTMSSHDVILLDVPGLPEKEPDLRMGSLVYLRQAKRENTEFVAIAVASHASVLILLGPDALFKQVGLAFHVKFGVDHEHYYERVHMSIQLADLDGWFGSGLGPSRPETNLRAFLESEVLADSGEAPPPPKVGEMLAAMQEGLNEAQLRTVCEVTSLKGQEKGLVCCTGPAGTGKSLTAAVVATFAAMVQQREGASWNRVLVTTPEEYTADLLALAIRDRARALRRAFPRAFGQELEIVRINDSTRPVAHAAPDVLPLCNLDERCGIFQPPHPGTWKASGARVIVSSCRSCFLLHRGQPELARDLGVGLLIIDEAGQAGISDVVAALGSRPSSVLVLGDEHQLGPSREGSGEWGDQRSGLDCWGPSACRVTLKRNYRSNAGLLEVPKQLFYGDDLDAVAPASQVAPPDLGALDVFHAPQGDGVGASVLTVGIPGRHSRSSVWAKGRSCVNAAEAEAVRDICVDLCMKRIATTEMVSVISLSRAQVQRIRSELRAAGLAQIRCGTVDDFQGQESEVVLISCVGSSAKALDTSKKRFNVAITRARRLLIVVGSLPVLRSKDAGPWHDLCEACRDRGSFLAMRGGDAGEGEVGEGEERESAMTRIEGMARSALLGAGNINTIFPETLYETNLELGWAATDDDANLPSRIEL